MAITEEVLGPRHPYTALCYTNLALNFVAQRRLNEAEPLDRKALTIRKEVLGPRHPDTAQTYADLAANLDNQGRYQEAESLHRQALAIREEVLGSRHLSTVESYNNLGNNLDYQGRHQEAEPLRRKALSLYEEVQGPRHAGTARSYANLAANLNDQGRHQEAEPLHRKAVRIYEEVLGSRHPATAASYDNLAGNLDALGRYQEAESLHRKALAIREQLLGPRHPDTANSCNNLANNLDHQGRAREAERLRRQALRICEEVLGPKHPYTATSYTNLASNLDAQGRHGEAEPLHHKALAIDEEVLGPRHPRTTFSYNNLAMNLNAQGRYQEAEPLFRKALAIKEEVLGSRHRETIGGYNNLAFNLHYQGRHKEAEPLLRKALATCEEVFGSRHPDMAQSYNNLAQNLTGQGRAREAEPLYRQALAVCEEVLGPQHRYTASSYDNLAVNLHTQGRYPEAEPLFRKALALREQVLGRRHPETAQSYNNLAFNLEKQGRYKEAERLLRQSLTIREEVLGPWHPSTALGYNNLASNLQLQGRYQGAEPFWQKSADSLEAARLRLAASTLHRAQAVRIQPHMGLATCRARLERPAEAWSAAEAGLARGLLDDLAVRAGLPADSEAQRRDRQRAARLDALDRPLIPLLIRDQLSDQQRRQRDELLQERAKLDAEAARAAAEFSRQAVLSRQAVQAALAADTALVFWVDIPQSGEHWGCVLRPRGQPAWVRLKGSGPKGEWTAAEEKLPRQLRDALTHGEPEAPEYARRLAAQRLAPLLPQLEATNSLPTVRHILVVPVGVMADIPLEVLTDRYLVSYVPSGTVFARLHHQHRPLQDPTLLALGDPTFRLPSAAPSPTPPEYGLYLSLVLPGGNAARHGLRSSDVLLSYAGTRLHSRADVQTAETGAPIPVEYWRDGVIEKTRLDPGKLGVTISEDPPALAQRKQRLRLQLADMRRSGQTLQSLPGTRLEVAAIASLLPAGKTTLLMGSEASEQCLDELAALGKLKQFRLLHLATHGSIDPISAAHSALELARDQLPAPQEQARLAAAGKKVPTGQLSVADIAERWQLDADLVTLSACETALGPEGGGEGLLGFAQVLLSKGARSLVLSLWKVDDTATALLMARFYQNLLGRREGLAKPLPKAEALQEAKQWLRTLPRAEVERLAGQLAQGAVRATEGSKGTVLSQEKAKPALPAGDKPFAHPMYWAAFILLGDPE